jgi:carbamoyl-phosphate synthase large subunit
MINIIVTGTGSLIGQAIIKSIRHADLPVDVKIVGCDYFEKTVGSFWCDKNYVLPDVLKDENIKKWQEKIIDIIIKEEISILFIGVDFELILFAKLSEEIKNISNCMVVVSDEKTINIGNDKYLTYTFLRDNKLNYPKTYLLSEINSEKIHYPCIIKPRIGARSKGVHIINDEGQLYEKAAESKDVIIQELIGNPETEYTCGVLYWDGKFINSIALKRILKEGNTYIAEYKNTFDEKIYKYIEKIVHKLNILGSCNFQLRLGQDGEPYVFEINPRYSGTTYMRHLFGFKEVEFVIRAINGCNNESFLLKEGGIYRYYEEKFL